MALGNAYENPMEIKDAATTTQPHPPSGGGCSVGPPAGGGISALLFEIQVTCIQIMKYRFKPYFNFYILLLIKLKQYIPVTATAIYFFMNIFNTLVLRKFSEKVLENGMRCVTLLCART